MEKILRKSDAMNIIVKQISLFDIKETFKEAKILKKRYPELRFCAKWAWQHELLWALVKILNIMAHLFG